MVERTNQLWKEYLGGNKEAFNELYSLCHPELIFYCNGKLKDTAMAEDVVSETLEKVLIKKDSYKIENFGQYLFSAAKNNCFTLLRKISLRHDKDQHRFSYYSSVQSPEVEGQLMEESLRQELSPSDQEIWELLNRGMDVEEIASSVGKSVKTVYRRTSYIKEKLKKVTT